jgi:hypothetical protein
MAPWFGSGPRSRLSAGRPDQLLDGGCGTGSCCQIGESIGEWLEQPIEHRAAATGA